MRYPLLLLALFTCSHAGVALDTKPDDNPNFDPAAIRVLDEMARTYRGLHSLEQDTTYGNNTGNTDLSRLTQSRLVIERPNHLLFEMRQIAVGQSEPALTRFVCDGRNLYVYKQQLGAYTKAKAPKDLQGFQSISISMEMALMTGLDPVGQMLKQARSVRLEEPTLIDGATCSTVALDTGTAARSGETRIYIGEQDHLLRRFSFESRILVPDPPQRQPDDLTDPPTPAKPIPARYGYENHVTANRPVAKTNFTWVAPAGALIYDPKSDKFVNPADGKLPNGATVPGRQKGKTGKAVPYQEYVKQMKKKQPPR